MDESASAREPAGAAATVTASAEALRVHRSSTAAAAPVTVDQAIAAAQTPDGQAIPQGPNADGTCPAVLVSLGFWSCPTIGQTCAFSSSDGVSHSCLCQRTDGEGQSPSWVCQ